MKCLFYLIVLSIPVAYCQAQTAYLKDIPSIKIRKKVSKTSFKQALSLPQTATSCDCPTNNSTGLLGKLGCQHPDTVAVCKVVITKFDVAVIPENGENAIVLKDIEGSFLNSKAITAMRLRYKGDIFVSYSNIKGMTEDGKEVVVPSFGTSNPQKRATRDYTSIHNYLTNLGDSKVYAFELSAYNANNQMVFRQAYNSDSFDKNAMRPDAVRYVFKDIKAKHSSGFEVEIDNFQVADINVSLVELLSSRE